MEPVSTFLITICVGLYIFSIFSDFIVPSYADVILNPSPVLIRRNTRPSVAIVKNSIPEREFFLDETIDEELS